jgi:hypothetical protein
MLWFWGRFLFKAGAELPLADLLSAHVGTVPDDLFESEEERAHPIYLTGSDQLTQGARGRAPFQNGVLVFSLKAVFSFSQKFLFFSAQVQLGRRHAPGFQAPQVYGQTPANGHRRLFAPAAGAVSNVDEPDVGGLNNPAIYFGDWAAERVLAYCAWNSFPDETQLLQVVGDPFTKL